MSWISALGLLVMMLIAWAMSTDRRKVDLRLVLSGVGLQLLFGVLVLKTAAGRAFFEVAREFVTKVISLSDLGAQLVFGDGFREHFFAFSVLSTIIFVSSVMAVLFYLGVIQRIVEVLAWVMMKVMNVSGAESLAATANVFVGQTEAPLVIKPYITSMTRSEIMALMVGGMATIAGGVMAAYASFGADPGHLLSASIMSAPASLVIAKLMVPETQSPKTKGRVRVSIPNQDTNVIDAACRGATEGLKLAANVAAMLIAFVAIAGLINYILYLVPHVINTVTGAGLPTTVTVELILSYLFAPLAFLMGVPWEEAQQVGVLLGKKTFMNEFVAYLDLKELKGQISHRAFTISTYALCGFANFSSIAIIVGGVGSLVPERRSDLAKFGVRAMIGGTLAAFMTACVAGMLI